MIYDQIMIIHDHIVIILSYNNNIIIVEIKIYDHIIIIHDHIIIILSYNNSSNNNDNNNNINNNICSYNNNKTWS